MNGYTPKQLEYINSVDGNAHMSAVEIIGDLEARHIALREAVKKMMTADSPGVWNAKDYMEARAAVDALAGGE